MKNVNANALQKKNYFFYKVGRNLMFDSTYN